MVRSCKKFDVKEFQEEVESGRLEVLAVRSWKFPLKIGMKMGNGGMSAVKEIGLGLQTIQKAESQEITLEITRLI